VPWHFWLGPALALNEVLQYPTSNHVSFDRQVMSSVSHVFCMLSVALNGFCFHFILLQENDHCQTWDESKKWRTVLTWVAQPNEPSNH